MSPHHHVPDRPRPVSAKPAALRQAAGSHRLQVALSDPYGRPWHPATVEAIVAIAATTATPWVPTLAALRDLDPPPGAGA